MAEYIEREALLREIERRDRLMVGDKTISVGALKRFILNRPSADVAPVRHRHCPYCDAKTNDFIPINQTVEYSGIEIALNRQGMLRVRVYESGQKTFTTQDIVEIKCCPNCGAKMGGGDE